LVVFALGIGACYGGAVALSPALVAEFFGTRELGFILGMLWTSCGAGTLVGLPLVGAIIDHTGSYRIGIGFTMSAAVIALMFLAPLGKRAEAASIARDSGETGVS
jgi:MFS family permease